MGFSKPTHCPSGHLKQHLAVVIFNFQGACSLNGSSTALLMRGLRVQIPSGAHNQPYFRNTFVDDNYIKNTPDELAF
jgi:hypothetical protein